MTKPCLKNYSRYFCFYAPGSKCMPQAMLSSIFNICLLTYSSMKAIHLACLNITVLTIIIKQQTFPIILHFFKRLLKQWLCILADRYRSHTSFSFRSTNKRSAI